MLVYKTLEISKHDQGMLIHVNPPIKCVNEEAVDTVVVAPRHAGNRLFPIEEMDFCDVYIVQLLTPSPEANTVLNPEEYTIQYRGEVYDARTMPLKP